MARANHLEVGEQSRLQPWNGKQSTEAGRESAQQFATVAERIVRGIAPGSVLVVGPASPQLVAALRDRGVEAFGLIGHVAREVPIEVAAYCSTGVLVAPPTRRYDLVVCLDSAGQLAGAETDRAVEQLANASADILVSWSEADPQDVIDDELRSPVLWARLFAEQHFFHDVDFDASFLAPSAMRFRKTGEPVGRVVADYERKLSRLARQTDVLREVSLANKARAEEGEKTLEQVRDQLADRMRAVEALTINLRSKDEALDRVNAQLMDREQTVAALVARLAEKEQQTAALGQQVAELEQTSELLGRQLADWERHWTGVQRSIAWRLVSRLRGARARIAPPGSIRERLWFSGFRRPR